MLIVLGLVLAALAFAQAMPFVTKEPMMPANDANSGISAEDASLLKAASEGDADMVKRTLAQGADIEARDYKAGNTPLIWASFNGQLKAIKVLVERGAKLDAVSDDGHKTALLLAAYAGHADTVTYLLQRGARINQANARGDTGIAIASFMNRTAVVDSLLLRRADLSLCSRDQRYTPLHLAAHKGHEVILEKLLVDGVAAKTVINAQDRDGHTPFMLAVLHNRTSAAAFLLQHAQEHGIELNRREKKGNTALALAVDKGHLGLVELLLADERLELDVQNRQGLGLLGLAAQKGRVEIFRQLLQAGANPHIADKKGRKALQVARETKCKACVELLSEFHRLSGEGSADDGGGGGDGEEEGLFRLEL